MARCVGNGSVRGSRKKSTSVSLSVDDSSNINYNILLDIIIVKKLDINTILWKEGILIIWIY
jgi:hypothetical protein